MKKFNLKNMKLGWFIGNFEPTVIKTEDFEIAVKRFNAGESEPRHYQKSTKEITVIVSGTVKIADKIFGEDDIIEIDPLEIVNFESITDSILVAIKIPSLPNDKFIA